MEIVSMLGFNETKLTTGLTTTAMGNTLAHLLQSIVHSIATSSLHDHVVYWLRNVPGLPPIAQTIHILSIGCVMGSIVLIDLRVLGFAVPSQNTGEMIRRLMPWMWVSLVLLLVSGAMFVIATPGRYFDNPIFGIKFALLIPAIALAAVMQYVHRSEPKSRASVKAVAALSLLLWVGVVLAGRWIAYVDYLFPTEGE